MCGSALRCVFAGDAPRGGADEDHGPGPERPPRLGDPCELIWPGRRVQLVELGRKLQGPGFLNRQHVSESGAADHDQGASENGPRGVMVKGSPAMPAPSSYPPARLLPSSQPAVTFPACAERIR